MIERTRFDCARLNRTFDVYRSRGIPLDLPPVSDYEGFAKKYPVTRKEDLRALANQMSDMDLFRSCSIVCTSGTSSDPTTIAAGLWEDIESDSYPAQLTKLIGAHVFSHGDSVANLFSAGGLGGLYEGVNRMLDVLKVTLLSVGRIDTLPSTDFYLDTLAKFRVNVLCGTPSSIIQTAHLAAAAGAELHIEKIVFTGEPFFASKRAYVENIWRGVKFYSLYGSTECGFIGLSTPSMPSGCFQILSDWYFLEIDPRGDLLVTDLRAPIVPLIRYRLGDRAELARCGPRKRLYLKVHGRSDDRFNYMGNLISFERLSSTITQSHGIDRIQVRLRSDCDGNDILGVAVEANADDRLAIRDTVLSLPEIREGVEKGVGDVEILLSDGMIFNSRTKLPPIVDERSNGGTGPHLQRPSMPAALVELLSLVERAAATEIAEATLEQTFQLHRQVAKLILALESDQGASLHFLDVPEVAHAASLYQVFLLKWEALVEALSRQANAGDRDPNASRHLLDEIGRHFRQVYRQMTDAEIKLLSDLRDRTVCQVGVGEMPLSLLRYRQRTGCRLIGLDREEDRVAYATDFLAHLGMSRETTHGAVELIAVDGADFDYHECDVVILAASVEPKTKVLQRIFDTRPNNITILNRSTRGWNSFLYPPSPLPTHARLQVTGTTSATPISTTGYHAA